jgi:8-amino-7-oxononanoate synthase
VWNEWISEQYSSLATIRTKHAKLNNHDPRLLNINNQIYLNFISNDYLGLSTHPKLIEALSVTAKTYGVGSTGAATLSGYTDIQEQLQIELADWLKFDQCLIFNSGYQLDVTLYSQLADAHTIIWLDKRCHASHIDGIRLAKMVTHAKFSTFHPDTIDDVIQKITSQIKNQPNIRHIILSEGIFSMDGTCTYLEKLINLRKISHNVLLIIDDAHGIGAIGANGYGSLELFINKVNSLGIVDNINHVDLLIGTMGKTFGTHGGFICGQRNVIDYLAQVVRGQLFTTCLPPAILAASRQSLKIIKSNEGHDLRARLAHNISLFKQLCKEYNLPQLNSSTNISPIQLLYLESENQQHHPQYDLGPIGIDGFHTTDRYNTYIKNITKQLINSGIYVGMMCYPTVAKNMPRIRVSLNAAHTNDDITHLCKTIVNANSILQSNA